MKIARKMKGLAVTAVLGSVLVAGQADAGVSCHKINAKGIGQDLGAGVTQAQIIGGGLLNGTTQGNFAITGGAPPVFSLAGTVMFTTKQATLTVTVSGTFDVSTGNFAASGPVTAATGKLAGATGTLMLEGLEDLATGKFVEDVRGDRLRQLVSEGLSSRLTCSTRPETAASCRRGTAGPRRQLVSSPLPLLIDTTAVLSSF